MEFTKSSVVTDKRSALKFIVVVIPYSCKNDNDIILILLLFKHGQVIFELCPVIYRTHGLCDYRLHEFMSRIY